LRISPNNMGAWLRLFNTPATAGTQQATLTAYNAIQTQYTLAVDSLRLQNFDWPAIIAGTSPWGAAAGPMPNVLPWAIAGSSAAGALPVELLNFTAHQSGSKVQVQWNTAAEINNDYFLVERSGPDQNDFITIDKVRSWFNNSSVPLYYESWDQRPLEGLQYYRLKQVDLDGKYTYSDVVAVTFDPKAIAPMPFVLINTYADQLAPGNINIEFSYNSEMPLDYIITDATGRTIATGSGIAAVPGTNKITLTQPLTRGMYIVTLRNKKEAVSRRFVY
jgi:hypothetical protein